jgi:hypothetical protein
MDDEEITTWKSSCSFRVVMKKMAYCYEVQIFAWYFFLFEKTLENFVHYIIVGFVQRKKSVKEQLSEGNKNCNLLFITVCMYNRR